MEKMKLSDRARIFLPFDALHGFREALKEQEKIKVEKKTLSEEQQDEISKSINQIKKGMLVKIVHYSLMDESYLETIGIVTRIDEVFKTIWIVKTKIEFSDIYSIKCIEENKIANE